MRDSSFTDINFPGAKLNYVNLTNVRIDDANIAGVTIFGWNIGELITDAQKRKTSN